MDGSLVRQPRRPRGKSGHDVVLAALAALVIVSMCLLTACSGRSSSDRPRAVVADETQGVTVVDEGPSAASVAASRAAFDSADIAFLATSDSVEELTRHSREAGAPVLMVEDQGDVHDELERLGVSTIVTASGEDLPDFADDYEVIEIDPGAKPGTTHVPDIDTQQRPAPVTAVVDPDGPQQVPTNLVTANVVAAGGDVVRIPGGDPRATSGTVEAIESAQGTSLVAVGPSFGTDQKFARRVKTASSAPELPGGGQVVFPHRRFVGLYGSPGRPSLGALGEQGIEASIERVKNLAKTYEPYSKEPVVPAFEIIATVAATAPGPDGNYSLEIDPETLRPWVEAARKAGVYVVLDLQPGRADILSQARQYERLLTKPYVGLAIDPEWRLDPGQQPLQQIGSVDVDEVNATGDWLADLTREDSLPQKVFVLHQFQTRMIEDRDQLDTSHPELAPVIHADGNGSPAVKMGTWNALTENIPRGARMGWKNFYKEDVPTFSPERTLQVTPTPWFVSYQ